MPDTVIKVENLSKQYRIGAKEGYKTFRETLVDAAKAPFQRLGAAWSIAHRAWSKRKDSLLSAPSSLPAEGTSPLPAPSSLLSPDSDTIWALKDVSFEVKQGEVVGIIGRNGAGKSTLLKILSKITEPTQGRVRLRGRVGSLLEVGTGFHPELTGHENVYLYGAILGMDRWEVTRKFDEIIVADHLEPEILFVDEVLAVGDASFQKKCLGKLWEISDAGRTVLFVSHNMVTINVLCSKAILLEEGKIESQGESHKIVKRYEQSLFTNSSTSFSREKVPSSASYVLIESANLQSLNGEPTNVYSMGDTLILRVSLHFNIAMNGLRFLINIKEMNGSPIYHIMNVDSDFKISHDKGRLSFLVKLKNLMLFPNNYLLSLYLTDSVNELLDSVDNKLSFTVTQNSNICRRRLVRSAGVIFRFADWELEES